MTDDQAPVRPATAALSPLSVEELLAEQHEELRSALVAVDEARREAERARVGLDAARAGAHRAMRRLGHAFLAAEQDAPPELLRSLYWDHPDVHVAEIAKAFGLQPANEVYRRVGPDEREVPCRGVCGATVMRRAAKRGEVNPSQRQPWLDPLRCETCRAVADRDHARDLAQLHEYDRLRAAEDAAVLEEIRRRTAAGEQPATRYVEFAGLPGTWRVEDVERA